MRQIPLSLLFISMIAFFSCSKEKTTSSKPATGSLTGTVQAWDDKLVSNADAAGITVTIEAPNRSAITDANGRFSFDNLAWGSYNLSFSKAGFGTYKLFSVAHQYSDTSSFTLIPTVGFGKLSTTTVTGLSVINDSLNGQPGVAFDYNLNPVPTSVSKAFVRYFLDTVASVSSSSYKAYSAVINYSSLSNIAGFTSNDLIAMGFRRGQTVFVKLYGDSFKSNDYTDPGTGKKVFPNVNPATVPAVSFVIP